MSDNKKSAAFGNLLKGAINGIANYEGKNAPIIEDELGALIGVSGKTIQRYKTGYVPPFDREHDAVRVLAEAAVHRGFLGRGWLERFLHAARYPTAEKLVDELCPAQIPRLKPERVYQNLPAPIYSQFVMREQAFAEVIDGLEQRSAAVLIVGMGGNGKTSLAREVAAHCVQDTSDVPRFDALVWVSDKDNPGTTNLSSVLDTIARTLDYPGFVQFSHAEKQYEVEQLLRRQKVLLILDNAETITDGALFTWLVRLPDPSKAIITTREYHRLLRRNSTPIELRGMQAAEARTLLHQWLERLRIAHLVHDQTELEPLLAATGGNPKALTMVAGLLKYEHRPLKQIVNDLYAARGDLFADLFSRAWALLDEAGKQILMVMTFFPDSASSAAVRTSADVTEFDFDRAVECLTDLSLLDVQQDDLNSTPRYLLHPLVRAFAGARLAEKPAFEREARERWVGWYVELASKVGYCWNDLNKLKLLDLEYEVLLLVLDWTYQNHCSDKVLRIIHGVWYYLQVRGLWDRMLVVEHQRYKTAQSIDSVPEKIYALRNFIHVLSRQNSPDIANPYVDELYDFMQHPDLPKDILAWCYVDLGWYWLARQDIHQAQQCFMQCISVVGDNSSPHYAIGQRSLALCLYQQGLLSEAKGFLYKALKLALDNHHIRNEVYIRACLAMVLLDSDDIQLAQEELVRTIQLAYQYNIRELIPFIQKNHARLHTLRGDLPAAHAALAEATDLFERMGMRHELAEARTELARLAAQMAALGEG